MVNCWQCNEVASVKRSRNGAAECVTCFTDAFETEVYNVITTHNLFKKGQKVAVGASGGKDSTVLIHVLNKLNQKYKYGLDIILLSVDEGIAGYRDESLESVQRNKSDYGLPLVIISYRELYGWTMDEVVSAVGIKNNCTFCGVFRRRALDRTAAVHGADVIATGHNADDMAETVLLNILRGDIARLQRCTDIITAWEEGLPRVKPLKYAFEKDIVMYAHFNKLDYFSTECKYSPDSFRSYVRAYVKELERLQPRAILDLIKSGEAISARSDTPLPTITTCEKCGCMSSQKICKTCKLLQGLSDGNYDLGVKKVDCFRV
ncbi:unnamed protein product [Thelazia callipaeda]|uniref:Cytoplasmic tRNA 2-thiolation protein 1 n=1 Tax=Thelazia callipaeda TaxID=103827 RepID=A0A0N5D4K7_THECL|nr:unnamed protein product [Thelazia callipaeda]